MFRLIYITNQKLPSQKAYGIQIVKMCEAFADLGYDTQLLIPTRGASASKDIFDYYGVKRNFKAVTLYSPDFYFPGRLDRLAVTIKSIISAFRLFLYTMNQKADFIYSRDELPIYFLSFFKKKLVFEAHKFSKNRRLFYGRFKKNNVKMVTISSGLKEEFVKFGFKPDEVLVAHDGVDVEEFNISKSAEQCRRELGLPLDKKIVGYVGQLRTMGMEKGISSLIHAQKELSKRYPDIITVIVGGNEADVRTHRQLAEKEGVNDKEMLFLGHKDHGLIPMYLKACDVLAMPFPNVEHYASYMSPLKLFEYMASGRPIVATSLPTIREVLNHSNAILVNPDDNFSFVSGVERLVADSGLASRIAKQALLDVEAHTWKKRVKQVLNYIS